MDEASTPDLSIIIVNWNVRDLLRGVPAHQLTIRRSDGQDDRRKRRPSTRLILSS